MMSDDEREVTPDELDREQRRFFEVLLRLKPGLKLVRKGNEILVKQAKR
jgi:hypothetical protein